LVTGTAQTVGPAGDRFLAPAQTATAPSAWAAELAAGCALTQQQAAELLQSAAQRV
jgi:hypothetical protein